MTREKAKEVLEAAGIKVEESTTLKNGERIPSLVCGEGTVRPTIYEMNYEDIDDPEKLVKAVKMAIEAHPDIKTDDFLYKDFVLENVMSCLRHGTGDDEIVKFEAWGDLEEYFRVMLDSTNEEIMSMVITKSIAEYLEITAEELQKAARENLARVASIKGLSEVLKELVEDVELPVSEVMFVGTNKDKRYGASVMLLDSVLDEFCKEHDTDKIIIIPSSIHEILIVNENEASNVDLNTMVQEVNESELEHSEILSNHIYIYERKH